MISVVEKDIDQKHMLSLCEKNPFGCKIAAIALAYGFDKRFSNFWMDREKEIVFCLVDNVMIISGTIVKSEEPKGFLQVSGAKYISCTLRNSEALGLMALDTGDILRKKIHSPVPVQIEDVSIRDIYALLEENSMIDDEFEAFYLDLSHRIRHNYALAIPEYKDKKLVGCSVISAITESSAIISAVAVQEDYRRQGLGSLLVSKSESLLSDKTVYVFREKNNNQEFYKKLGYAKADSWIKAAI